MPLSLADLFTRTTKVPTPALMFQGTCSNAGKSILTTALCRILLQDGVSVAPFKSQNMSLNSFVTRNGEEMGRAQVVQAQAARLEADVRMNPVLIKPNSDTGSQIIVMGRPVGNMNVANYLEYKPKAFLAATRAFDALAAEHDVIIMEGAGSPAEVNLKHHDIVNMPMARYAGAKVLLVGDIDRGGVFASLLGTMEILDSWERELLCGFVINRFRGDRSLLDDALAFTEKRTGKPVLGVIDFIPGLGLPEEDSVSFKNGIYDGRLSQEKVVEIALIDLPHIANFTDIEPFLAEPDVCLRIVRKADDLGTPAAIILPGSKNVAADLAWLKHSGLTAKISALGRNNTPIIGICGGFQMLGRRIQDPLGLESARKCINGLGFLDLETVLAPDKTLTRQQGTHRLSGLAIRGYEIHHGQTFSSAPPLLHFSDGSTCGVSSDDGLIWGAYLHGIFDDDHFRRWFLDGLRRKQGLAPMGRVCAPYDLEPAFDRLAATVRAQLDLAQVYRLLGL
ncbi:MAG: cobyric acid synthase [Desulfobulbaceae bacterium]|nr:cobyric acid synthase [Desulfobulbaceae bacterium]